MPGNGGSLEKCRRRWDLCDAEFLRYKDFAAFDRAMTHLDKAFGFLSAPHSWVSRKDEGDKLVVCEKGDLVFIFNFHPTNSYTDYRVGCLGEGESAFSGGEEGERERGLLVRRVCVHVQGEAVFLRMCAPLQHLPHPPKKPNKKTTTKQTKTLTGPYKLVLSSDEQVFGGWQNLTKVTDAEHAVTPGTYDGRPNSFQVYAPSRTCSVYAPAEWADPDADTKPHGVPGLGVRDVGPYYAY